MEFLLFVAFIWLIISHLSLRGRVTRLEEKQTYRQSSEAPSTKPTPATSIPQATPAPHPDFERATPTPLPKNDFPQAEKYLSNTAVAASTPLPPEATAASAPKVAHTTIPKAPPAEPHEFFLVTWFKEQTLIKIGSIIFFLGAIWFVSYAIENDWISPITRILLGVLLGVAVYAVGSVRKLRVTTQYQVLTALGTGIILGTVTASQFAFATPVLPAAVAFVLMISSIAYTLLVAIKTDTEWLGVAASVAGLIVPFLINTPDHSAFLLLTYVLLLSASFVAVVFFTAWRGVTVTALFGAALHVAIVASAGALSDVALWIFAILFSALFFSSTTVSILRTNRPTSLDITVLATTTLQFVLYALAYAAIPELAFFSAAAITAGVGYVLRQRGAHADAVSIYAAISLIGIVSGTTLLFDGFVLTIAFAVEVLAVYLLTLRIATVQRSVFVAALLFLLPLSSGLNDLDQVAHTASLLQAEFLGTLFVLGAVGFAALWTLRAPNLRAIDWLRHTAATLLVGWYAFAVFASLVVAEVLDPVVSATAVATILTTIIAALYIWYAYRHMNQASWCKGSLLTLAIPTLSSLASLEAIADTTGIFQLELLATIYLLALIAGTAIATLRSNAFQTASQANTIGGGLWVVAYVLTVLTTFSVAEALDYIFIESFTVTMILTVVAIVTITFSLQSKDQGAWHKGALATLIIPTIAAVTLLSERVWHDGIAHQAFLGALVYVGVLLGVTLVHWLIATHTTQPDRFRTYAYWLTWVTFLYSLAFLYTVWDTLLTGDFERVVTALSHLVVIYLIINFLFLMKERFTRVVPFGLVLILPILSLLPSFDSSDWDRGLLDVNALGLYITITILSLLATTIRHHANTLPESERTLGTQSSTVLYTVAGIAGFGLVWGMSHSVFSESAIAVTAALFVYTISGLTAYVYGKANGSSGWRRAGILLLIAVVLRLALVDFWTMELLWKIVTFLVIGALFIGAALLERPQRKSDQSGDIE